MFPLLSVLIIFFLFLAYKYYEHRNIYIPAKEFIITPDEIGINYKEINFSSADYTLLNGWYIEADSDRVIIFLHGHRDNISYRMEHIGIIQSLGYNLFIFDYKGFGKSNGYPTETGLYNDGLGAYRTLLKDFNFKPEEIILFGRSLGGAVAIHLASLVNVNCLIIESGFLSIYHLSYDILGFHVPKWLISNRYESINKIEQISIPKLLIHSENDELIPYYHGIQLFEAAQEPKKFLKIQGTHNTAFIDSKDLYSRTLQEFLESCKPE